MRRSALFLFVVACGCSLRRDPPPPPPPAPPVSAAPVTTVAAPTIPSTAPGVPPTALPPSTGMMPVASGVPTGVPPTTVMPHASAIRQRAAHCCTTASARVPRYIPRHGHSPRELLLARDAQCGQAIGLCAEAFMQMGERPPEYCTQPGRHASEEW